VFEVYQELLKRWRAMLSMQIPASMKQAESSSPRKHSTEWAEAPRPTARSHLEESRGFGLTLPA
jgi:hypothetical protein